MPQTLACGQFVVGEDDGVSEFLNSKGLFGRLTVDGEVVLVRVNECYCADMISGFLMNQHLWVKDRPGELPYMYSARNFHLPK